jgi:glycosyltransferase involved in cell wall biosynthesis
MAREVGSAPAELCVGMERLGASRVVGPIGAQHARVAVVGMSSVGPTCGARDHALLLAEALGREHVACSLHWLWRGTESIRMARSEVRVWAQALAVELDRDRPDAILLHYSVFAYSYRGLPLFVAPTLAALRGTRIPVLTVLHEFVYPWRHGGWRGKVWALAQRALLVEVMRCSRAVLVTTDFRAEWLATRPWLPRRPTAFAPVFSNLPAPAAGLPPRRGRPVVGLFGYSYQGAAVALVLDAVQLLNERGLPVELLLLGAPGRSSPAAEIWLRAARARDLAGALSFTGTRAPQDLSDTLAECEVLLFADASGPSSRKGTLAASLASGSPVVAIDGPRRWPELVRGEAAQVVQPTAPALAHAIGALLADAPERDALGARGRAFAEARMGVKRTADAVTELLAGVTATRAV